ncbi:mitochondrial carrier [Amanita rubescens]|nr:mitochondrial carrier [Amanita rubescens]
MSDAIEASAKVTGLAPTVDFIAGTLSGIAGLIVGHPFDTIKVRFQSPTISGKYSSTLHAFGSIVHEERLAGLFKGITSPLITAAFLNGLIFSSYHFFLKVQHESNDAIPTLTQIAIAGALTGVICSVITTPTELIKIRQQDQLVHTSTSQIALKIFKESGVPGLYRGMTVTILRDIGYAAYFVGYEGTLRFLSGSTAQSAPWYTTLVAGGVAGIVGWTATFPLDVVKTRMQGTAQDSDPYRSMASTIINSYRAEGMGVFFRGLAPTIIRAIPVNMVMFGTFEMMTRVLS